MYRTGSRHHKLAAIVIELAIGQPEGVTGEDMTGLFIEHTDVMTGVTGRVKKNQWTPVEHEHRVVWCLNHAPSVHRQNLAIECTHMRLTIDRHRALDQFARIYHVAGAARMHGELRIGQLGHQQPGAAGMIKVDVGENQVIDIGLAQAAGMQGSEDMRHRAVDRAIDHRDTAVFNDQMNGVELRTQVV